MATLFCLLGGACLAAACQNPARTPAAELDATRGQEAGALGHNAGHTPALPITDAATSPPERQAGADAARPRDASELGDALPAHLDAAVQGDAIVHSDGGAQRDAAVRGDATLPALEAGADASNGTSERTRDFVVGGRRIEISSGRGRTLPVQIWYPAVDSARSEAEQGHPLEDFESAGARRALLTNLIAHARPGCPNLTMHAALEAAPYPRNTKLPLVVLSHHFSGSRFSTFSVAESLAQQGIVAVAPDHVNGSLFDRKDALTDSLTQLNDEFLQTRAADLKRVLDVMLDETAEVVPHGLRGRIDPAQVGAAGHSWGGITVGIFSAQDTRVKASVYIAIAPRFDLGALLLTLPNIERFRTPALYVIASEDNVLAGLGGNQLIVENFERQTPPAWLVELKDAGHFSFADDCELVEEFGACCGTGTRTTGRGEEFSYVEPKLARDVAARYTTLFFASQLQAASAAPLDQPVPAQGLVLKKHGARGVTP